jgi:PAS domain S-box-containing protein
MAMGIRSKVLLPHALECALLAVVLIAALYLLLPLQFIRGAAPLLIAGAFLLSFLGAALLLNWRVRRPLLALTRSHANEPADSQNNARDEIAALHDWADRLQRAHRDDREALAQATHSNQELQTRLRELEERYQLAVEHANDGSWDWNLRNDSTEFSPRWKGMLHCSAARFAHIDEWKQLIAPEDREAVLMRIQNHVQGLTPHFDADYRLRDGEGRYRWIHSRGIAVRGAGGSAYRLIVMDQDIHARKQLETLLVEAAEGLASVSGEEFFKVLAEKLAGILGTRDNLVAFCVDEPPTRARTLAYFSLGKHHDNFEFELAGTSCAAVIARGDVVYCPTGVSNIWPVEKDYDRDSYVGVPMFDSNGKVIGHFACMDGAAMRHDLPHLAVFRIFSVRAAAELERLLLKRRLEAVHA